MQAKVFEYFGPLNKKYQMNNFFAPPTDRQWSFSNDDLSVVRPPVRPPVRPSGLMGGGEGSISKTLQ